MCESGEKTPFLPLLPFPPLQPRQIRTDQSSPFTKVDEVGTGVTQHTSTQSAVVLPSCQTECPCTRGTETDVLVRDPEDDRLVVFLPLPLVTRDICGEFVQPDQQLARLYLVPLHSPVSDLLHLEVMITTGSYRLNGFQFFLFFNLVMSHEMRNKLIWSWEILLANCTQESFLYGSIFIVWEYGHWNGTSRSLLGHQEVLT